MGHRAYGVDEFRLIIVHPHYRSLPNHISCGTMLQPLTKHHGDDNHLVDGGHVELCDSRSLGSYFCPREAQSLRAYQCYMGPNP